jgi:hypothetical protein
MDITSEWFDLVNPYLGGFKNVKTALADVLGGFVNKTKFITDFTDSI